MKFSLIAFLVMVGIAGGWLYLEDSVPQTQGELFALVRTVASPGAQELALRSFQRHVNEIVASISPETPAPFPIESDTASSLDTLLSYEGSLVATTTREIANETYRFTLRYPNTYGAIEEDVGREPGERYRVELRSIMPVASSASSTSQSKISFDAIAKTNPATTSEKWARRSPESMFAFATEDPTPVRLSTKEGIRYPWRSESVAGFTTIVESDTYLYAFIAYIVDDTSVYDDYNDILTKARLDQLWQF